MEHAPESISVSTDDDWERPHASAAGRNTQIGGVRLGRLRRWSKRQRGPADARPQQQSQAQSPDPSCGSSFGVAKDIDSGACGCGAWVVHGRFFWRIAQARRRGAALRLTLVVRRPMRPHPHARSPRRPQTALPRNCNHIPERAADIACAVAAHARAAAAAGFKRGFSAFGYDRPASGPDPLRTGRSPSRGRSRLR